MDMLNYFNDRFEKVKDDELIFKVTKMSEKQVKTLDLLNEDQKIENTFFIEVMTLKKEKNKVIAKYLVDFVIDSFKNKLSKMAFLDVQVPNITKMSQEKLKDIVKTLLIVKKSMRKLSIISCMLEKKYTEN